MSNPSGFTYKTIKLLFRIKKLNYTRKLEEQEKKNKKHAKGGSRKEQEEEEQVPRIVYPQLSTTHRIGQRTNSHAVLMTTEALKINSNGVGLGNDIRDPLMAI